MSVKFIEPASIELDDAIEYYNLQTTGLGNKFLDEVLITIELIEKYPESWSVNSKNTRKAVLRNSHII